jgi:murein DD-endopeptidase MepM/ murein hydrolase activator NlpD
VVLSKDLFYGGNTLIVDHGTGLYSVYMHLSRFNAKEGSSVEKGQTVGFVGSSGRATGPHLHLSVKLNGFSVNPESLFKLEL